MKKLLSYLVTILVTGLLCFVLFYQKKPDIERIQNEVRQVERIKFDKFKDRYETEKIKYLSQIDSLKNIRQQIKIKYKEKILYVTDTCQLLHVENQFLKSDNEILEKEVRYYSEALQSCDSNFIDLLNYCEKHDSIKTDEINRLLSDSVSQQNIIEYQKDKIRTKNRKLITIVTAFAVENILILLMTFAK